MIEGCHLSLTEINSACITELSCSGVCHDLPVVLCAQLKFVHKKTELCGLLRLSPSNFV